MVRPCQGRLGPESAVAIAKGNIYLSWAAQHYKCAHLPLRRRILVEWEPARVLASRLSHPEARQKRA